MAGPSDFMGVLERWKASAGMIKLFGGPLEERIEIIRQASPVTHVSADAPPMLIVHGTEDPLVPLEQAETLQAAMQKVGGKSTLIKMVGGGHGIQGDEIATRIHNFFDRHLRGKNVEISAEPITAPAPPRKQPRK
jgi:dipeptidyl aminopeptidase/acylaminoacyl peptidase